MESVKSFIYSRTVWSALVGLITTALHLLGFGAIDEGAVVDAILAIVQAGSYLAAIFFRIVAKDKVVVLPVK